MNTVAYAYKNQPNILKISSSGGAFLGIVERVFQLAEESGRQAVVYGAKWTEDLQVVHARATTFKECRAFCGSKYVQSDLQTSLQDAENDLREGKMVLFSGTPCQIASVSNLLKTHDCPTEHLITVDIACHGVPQPDFWNEYKTWLEQREGAKLKKFSFRYKPKGWKGYPIYAEFENGKVYKNSFRTSHYMTIFRKGLLMRPGCFNCPFPDNFRSDITIADFWGVELCMPEISTKGGVSLMLCHTEQGEALAKRMEGRPLPDDTYRKYNHNLTQKTPKPSEYETFWKDYEEHGIDFVLKKYGGDTFSGRVRFGTKRFLRSSGLMSLGKKILKKP